MDTSRNFKNQFVILMLSLIFDLVSFYPLSLLFYSSRRSPKEHHNSKFFAISVPPATQLVLFASITLSLVFLGFYGLHFTSSSAESGQCTLPSFSSPGSASTSRMLLASVSSMASVGIKSEMSRSLVVPLPVQGVVVNVSKEEEEFWKQPDGEGYKPCLDFSLGYRKASAKISKEKRKFLVVVASGGLNQQRNQIVDAVIIARILGAALVLPVLEVNLIWGDESEFADIFDVENFKRILRPDVRIVSSLPSTHLMSRQTIDNQIPYGVSPLWIRSKFSEKLKEEGLLVLKGLDSKLSKNLPLDLQKLRCKVAFHALRFAAPIHELGDRLARRMWIKGPYIALHLRLEEDVWIRSGCSTGLGPKYDRLIAKIRKSRPEFLTGKLNMSNTQRKLSGICPLNAAEMARFLKALGASRSSRIYIAGGEPFGGSKALQSLSAEFPNLVTRNMLTKEGELEPYVNKASTLAAFDYIVALSGNVFIPSHGGNMGRMLQGHRAYVGHRKVIKPNKRAMLPVFEDSNISEAKFRSIIKAMHKKSRGQPELRTSKRDLDVIAHPVPECMCKHQTAIY